MFKKLLIVVSVIVQLSAFAFSEEKEESFFYDICKKNVESVDVGIRDNKYYVQIRLTEKARKKFADVTGENVNKVLWVNAGHYLFARGIIHSRIESNTIHSFPMTEQDALSVQRLILSDTDLRCGFLEMAIQENIWKPHLKKYLQDKYPRVEDVIAESIVRTKNGTKGHLLIDGEIEPIRPPQGVTKEERVVEIVKDLFMQEKELFGFRSEEEFRVDNVKFNKIDKTKYPNGRSDYMFNVLRYVGDARVDAYFIVHVTENEKVSYIAGNMEIVLPEVYGLASKPTIDKEKAAAIIIAEFGKDSRVAKPNKIEHLEKMAVNEDPFIVWRGNYNGYGYTIDAFTGYILKKAPPRIIVD